MSSFGVLKSNFLSSLLSNEVYSSSTFLKPSTSFLPIKQKNGGIVASQPNNNASQDNNTKTTGSKGQFRSSLNYHTPILDTINHPTQMKNLSLKELENLAKELRQEIIHRVSITGRHLYSSLGVAELTVSLHHVFKTPQDKIIWDSGHQAYPHKILTGRRSKMNTVRQTSGLSGFPKRDESVHDAFGVGHGSTSISAGLGMAVGRDLLGKSNHVISVIGDGAMAAGQAYEAMNNAGYLDSNFIIVLNDNRQCALGQPQPNEDLSVVHGQLGEALKGDQTCEIMGKLDSYMSDGSGISLFEELGLYYIGPVDGHNVEDLVYIFQTLKDMPAPGPVLVHIMTEKGRDYPSVDKMHGKPSKIQSYTECFGVSLVAEAAEDDNIVAIHAGTGASTGLNEFQKHFPYRCFDVGTAEQHAVTFAAGLATEGLKPFVAIPSSFLQRGYDQIVRDVDQQKLPVRFAIDGAGLVGEDGPTHCGAFDTTFMASLPNMVVMAPSCESELINMVATAASINDRPSCFRYPRRNGPASNIPLNTKGTPIEVGKGRILRKGSRVALLGYGTMVQNCLAASEMLELHGISTTVADARFCKPLDATLITQLAEEHEILISVEEGSIGGFGSHVTHFLTNNGLLDGNLKWRSMMLPDRYIEHGSQANQIDEAGIDSNHISATVLSLMGRNKESMRLRFINV